MTIPCAAQDDNSRSQNRDDPSAQLLRAIVVQIEHAAKEFRLRQKSNAEGVFGFAEDGPCSFACVHSAPGGLECPGVRSGRAARAGHRALWATSAPWMGLATRISLLGRRPLCLARRRVGRTASPACRVGTASLGSSPWRMGAGGRALAITRRTPKKSGARGSAFRRPPRMLPKTAVSPNAGG